MKAYVCCFMVSVAIILGAWLHKDQDVSHKCENTSRIDNMEAAISELITASEDQSRTIDAISESVLEWNVLFLTLYK